MDEIDKIRLSCSDGLRKIGKLGSGAYGKVYSALNNKGYKIAVKRSNISKNYEGSTNCLQELDTLQIVRDYPFFIQIVAIYFTNPFINSNSNKKSVSSNKKNKPHDKIYLAMEMGNTDAYQWIHKCNNKTGIPYTITDEDKKLFMVQTLLSLEFLHSREIYHRDIKSNNIIIFLDNNGRLKNAKITDFGLATAFTNQSMSVPGVTTSWYRAPEVSLNKNYDYKIDIWSLACIFYELICHPHNKYLATVENDTEILKFHWCNFIFPEDDYYIYRELCKSEIESRCRKEIIVKNKGSTIMLEKDENYIRTSVNNFDDIHIYKKYQESDPGIHKLLPPDIDEKLLNLFKIMFVVSGEKRASATKCLNHPYFDTHREMIISMRNKYRINNRGEWILQPMYKFSYKSCSIRKIGMKWFSHIYNNRSMNNISEWYSHRTLFQGIRLFDQYLILDKDIKEVDEMTILIWVNIFLFIAYKYFNVMLNNKSITNFSVGINNTYIILTKGINFEEYCLKNFFSTGIYSKTIFEYSPEYLTEKAIEILLRVIINEEIPSNTLLSDFWRRYEYEIYAANRESVTVK